MNVGEHTTAGNGDISKKLVEFLIVSDGQLKVTGNNSALLVITGSVTGKFKNFSTEVLEDGTEVHWGTSTDALRIASILQVSSNTTNRELQTSLRGLSLTLSVSTSTLSFTFTTNITTRVLELRGLN